MGPVCPSCNNHASTVEVEHDPEPSVWVPETRLTLLTCEDFSTEPKGLHRSAGAANIAAVLRHHRRDATRPLHQTKII